MSVAANYDERVSEQTFRLDAGKVGMIAFLCSEVAFFSSLFVAYIVYLGDNVSGPTPAEALDLWPGVLNTVFLLSSSYTMARATANLMAGDGRRFLEWLASTVVLGAGFLLVTANEWYGLIFHKGLTIYTNLFGTTYFTLVGFHTVHVTVGLVLMVIMAGLALAGRLKGRTQSVELVAWYWHFVDTVWIGIFAVVYVFGR